MYLDPFKSIANSRLFALQQILLLVLFHAAFLMSLCNDQELTYASGAHLCDRFGVGSAFAISMATAIWNLVLVIVILGLIIYQALKQSTAPTLRCSGSASCIIFFNTGVNSIDQVHVVHAGPLRCRSCLCCRRDDER